MWDFIREIGVRPVPPQSSESSGAIRVNSSVFQNTFLTNARAMPTSKLAVPELKYRRADPFHKRRKVKVRFVKTIADALNTAM
jgi:hypothetical protein